MGGSLDSRGRREQVTQQENPPRPKKPPVAPKPARYQSLADLLREVYGAKRKRLALTKSDLDAMQSAPKPEPAQRDELLSLAASDRTLERTRELLLLTMEKLAHHPLAGQVRDFVREVLRRHPAYQSPSLNGVLENLPDAVADDTALEALAVQNFAQLRWPEGLPALTKSELEQGRLNAVNCLLLWMRETRGTTMERIQRYLYTAFWAPAAGRQKSDGKVLRTLMQARDRVALGIACSTLEEKVREKTHEAVAARDAEERVTARANKLQSDLEGSGAQLEAEQARTKGLNEQIETQRREHENEKAHLRNDYEELRGRMLRRLRQEVTLLDEGLHALKKQPPKTHVMEDHAERAIHALKGEIERIKGED